MTATLPYPCLCLVTDRSVCPPEQLPARVAAAVAGGVDLVQLRDKELPGGDLLALASHLRQVMPPHARLLVNERADVAAAANADGVQLGEAALPTESVRPIIGADALIGRSVHSVAAAVSAAASGADFLLVGTMFATRSHPGAEPAGPDLLRRIAAGVPLPIIAIGGINAGNAPAVMDAGAHGVAVITGILASPDPATAARRLKAAITARARPGPRRRSQPQTQEANAV